MKTKIIKQEKNPFLEREEFVLEIANETSPTFDEVKKELGKDLDLTVVKKIHTSFGKQTFLVEAVVYDSFELKEKIETIPKKIRKKIEADKKKAEEEAKKVAEETEKAKKENAEKVEEKEETTEEKTE